MVKLRNLKKILHQIIHPRDLRSRGITYKSSPGSGAGGSGNYDVDLPKDVDPDKSISDPDFWNTMENLGDSEDESEPAEAPKPSPPTYELTKKAISESENDQTTNPVSPVAFTDWEGENKLIKSKELKKTLYAHGYEAGVVSSEDLIPCPIQDDPDKFQRTNCAKITDEGLDKWRDKIIDLATSTKPGMIKIELPIPMPYYDTEQAVGHLDMTTGDCVFFHQNGKYWSYKKYTPEEVKNVLPKCDSVKVARENPELRPEL